MLNKALSYPLQLREPYENCVIVKAYQLPALEALERMLQIIVEAVTYVVDDKSFSVVYYVPCIPWPVGYWLYELLTF
jgi:hypothetical protein